MFTSERSSPGRPFRDARRNLSAGFTLLLVVVVLGFVALIVVALATHLHIEQTLVLRRLQLEQAKRHALTGLSLALGHLQAATGPDARFVASAPIRGGVVPNKTHWIGVWRPNDDVPTWLVSSVAADEPDPTAATFTEAVVLVGPASAEISGTAANDPDQVRVDTIPLTIPAEMYPGWSGAADPVVGRTAYWIGDEAGKLSVIVPDERSAVVGEAPPDPWPRMDLAPLWNGFDVHAPSAQTALAKVLVYGQLGYVDATAFSSARLRRNFHRATVAARSVLSNPVGGGLKQEAHVDGDHAYGDPAAPEYDRVFLLRNPPVGTDPDRLPAARFIVRRPDGETPPASTLSGPRAAAGLLLAGGFNLNAVSDDVLVQRERWRAVLSVARTLHFPGDVTRALADAELDALAAQLTALRLRAAYPDVDKTALAPFRSVGQFARSGLLQAAIDATPINDGLTLDAPDRVDQADLLAMLAPILVIRSDTFLVRAYGEVLDPIRKERVGEVWCEAIVQRLPEYVDPTDEAWDPATTAVNLEFGRRCVVVSFRWLTAADL